MLYLLARQTKSERILEVGIDKGYTSYWLAHAAMEAKNNCGHGVFFGIDNDAQKVENVDKNLAGLSVDYTIFHKSTLDLTANWVVRNLQRLDFIFLDGDHTKTTIEHEVSIFYPVLSQNGLFLIHDSLGVSKEGRQSIEKNPKYNIESITIPGNSGITLFRKLL